MRFPPLIAGRFVRRENRFRATVAVNGAIVAAHVPTSGRLAELLQPERSVWLISQRRPGRKTAYDLILVEHGETLVSVDARLPNHLFKEYLQVHGWEGTPLRDVAAEVRFGASRLDFLLQDAHGPIWVEVKSVTLAIDEVALFPDAPTTRGTRHLQALMAAVREGARAAVVFIAQRSDVARFAPHWQADPLFAKALEKAQATGVQVRAWACEVSQEAIVLARPLPVLL